MSRLTQFTRRGAVLAFALAVFPTSSMSQSLYSLRDLGEETIPAPARERGLGGTGTASHSPSLWGNPALVSFADRTMFTGTYFTDWTRTEETKSDGSENVRQSYAGTVTNIGILFPLPRRYVFGTGLLIDRRIEGKIVADAMVESQSYEQTLERNGNLLRIPLVVARAWNRTRIGFGSDFVLLNTKSRWKNVFPDTSGFASSSDLDRSTLWSFEPRLGIRQELSENLALGAAAAWPRELRGTRHLESDDPEDETENVELHEEGDLAPSIRAGVDARLNDRIRLAFDWNWEGWSEKKPPQTVDSLDDVHRLALGAEWTPPPGGGLWGLPLRVGFRTQTLAPTDVEGGRIRESTASLGSGFGFSGGNGQFDWAFEYGRRGQEDNEFRETFYRFGVTLVGFEKWTKRRPPESEE